MSATVTRSWLDLAPADHLVLADADGIYWEVLDGQRRAVGDLDALRVLVATWAAPAPQVPPGLHLEDTPNTVAVLPPERRGQHYTIARVDADTLASYPITGGTP